MADKISKETGISREKGRTFLRKILKTISDDIVYTGHIELKGIGIFEVNTKPSQTIKHPTTGEALHVPEKKVLRYRSSKAIRTKLNPQTIQRCFLYKIKVPPLLLKNPPPRKKIKDIINSYKHQGEFNGLMTVNANTMTLVDGYELYIAARELNLTGIKAKFIY